MEVKGIARETLGFILEVSRSTYPNEFAGLLEAKDGIITDVLILPGTESSEINAVLKLFMMPNISAVGSVHSHPSSAIRPSKADLRLFSKTGTRHIIAGHPYGSNNWKCYDGSGNPVELPVLDVEIEDDDIL
ncbi:metal-dependent protease of the PAD1/JAB1 superfamily [Methanolobus halotolerans]|uniref:Metal-dependent protease of the PAD1/JAB1 superfamily n=1 Tax=Methanolobus halotolerans TaxID=2052935 RepID=A0A4E0PUK1_9EURY|nr:metal-dependent protease of the PAD1/JAB1 superfamily [Methanolobus halotolerans]